MHECDIMALVELFYKVVLIYVQMNVTDVLHGTQE